MPSMNLIVDVDFEEIVQNMDEDQMENLIYFIEKEQANSDFLERLTLHFMKELKKEKNHLKDFSFDEWFKEME